MMDAGEHRFPGFLIVYSLPGPTANITRSAATLFTAVLGPAMQAVSLQSEHPMDAAGRYNQRIHFFFKKYNNFATGEGINIHTDR